jgi:DNA-binding response OmpR family regulator
VPTQRVLVTEDDPELSYLLSEVIGGDGREVIVATTAAKARDVLATQDIALLILDLVLPDADGRSLLAELRSNAATATLAVIVVTSRSGPELRADCYELGADSFVEKPFDPEVLASDVELRLQRAAVHEREAFRDLLTGLLNLPGLVHEMESAPEGDRPIIAFELDGLRSLSTRFGWGTAEMTVSLLAESVGSELPADVHFGRLGGGEFCVFAPGLAVDGLAALADAIVENVRKVPVTGPDGETFRLTASAGRWHGEAGTAAMAALESARGLVQRARAEGGNRVAAPHEGPVPDDEAALVLVAEDDDITAKILCHRLEREGFRVERYDNGQDAYKGALDAHPTLVLLDVKMPGMDGFEVLERLRKTPSYVDVPIVMLTSMGSEADVVRGFRLGADDYMLKPFSPTELVARLRRLLRRGRPDA